MKRTFLFIIVIVIGIILASFSNTLSSVWLRTIHAQEVAGSVERQPMILAATVQITMFQVADDYKKMMARGLGTLVQHEGQPLIVTHDHWGDFEANTYQVEFRDANNALLLTLDGMAFLTLIRYRDEGTMILDTPAELRFAQSAFLNHDDLSPGAVVMVVRRQQNSDGRSPITTMPATVTAVAQREERPIYVLRSLDGQAIVQGDSGGGVWWNGRLVGNTWATELNGGWQLGNLSIGGDVTTTDISITAQFPQLSPHGEAVTDLLDPGQINQIHNGVRE